MRARLQVQLDAEHLAEYRFTIMVRPDVPVDYEELNQALRPIGAVYQ